MLRNQKGFTLMELMIVIVIIGVLAAIGVPAYSGYVERANKAVCKSNRRSIETAVQLYKMDYPTADLTGLEFGAGDLDTNPLAEYITNLGDMLCPKHGAYSVDASGKVSCDYEKGETKYHTD